MFTLKILIFLKKISNKNNDKKYYDLLFIKDI